MRQPYTSRLSHRRSLLPPFICSRISGLQWTGQLCCLAYGTEGRSRIDRPVLLVGDHPD
uniref:Uncharacterized protein n=1 Tax=Stenotrophomonas maltophilia TaxID=40324 RepID=A0A0A0R1P0_STEMA|nr:hypothetical protein [Stenotrophomonas maltophilia]